MEIKYFAELSESEKELMFLTPALVTILIAGADNNIDELEKKMAHYLTKLKKTTSEPNLENYFTLVSNNFNEVLERQIAELPGMAKFRNPYIREELTKVNDILKVLDSEFAMNFYTHIKEIAKYVAEASGGVMGYLSVSKEEAQALDNLEMILKPKAK